MPSLPPGSVAPPTLDFKEHYRTDFSQLTRTQNLIIGVWFDADSGESIDVTDTSIGKFIQTVLNSGLVEAHRAIEAACT